MKIIAYLRVSTDKQDIDRQKLEVLQYAHSRKLTVDDFMEVHASSQRSFKQRLLHELFDRLKPGDTLLVSELSRLGRSLGQIIQIVDSLIKHDIRFVAIQQNIVLDGKQDMQSKVMIALFGLFAEIERDLISERTKSGLQAARAKGKVLGRPKGALGTSRLNGKEEEIRIYLKKKVSKSSIAKILDISRTALYMFIKSRNLDEDVVPIIS